MHQAYVQSPRRDSLNKRIIAAVAVAILVGCAVVLYVITRTESPEAVVAQAPTAPRQSGDRPEFPEAPQAVPPRPRDAPPATGPVARGSLVPCHRITRRPVASAGVSGEKTRAGGLRAPQSARRAPTSVTGRGGEGSLWRGSYAGPIGGMI